MAGSIAGGKSAAETNKERHGEDFYVRIGRIGGVNGTTGGFYANRKLARIVGAKGGRNGSRAGIRNGAGKSISSLNRYKKKARIDAREDFQDGFNEERSNWFQAMARRIK